jgi:hypothetical protein
MLMRLLGFGPGEPSMPKLVMMRLIRDKNAVRDQLRAWAMQSPRIERVIVSHGAPVENPSPALTKLADALA